MQDHDYVRRFVFDNIDARGCIVGLDKTTAAIQQTHYYPPNLAKMLNEFALAAVLLHDSLKIKCSVTIQLRSANQSDESAIRLIMADCMSDRRVRAISEYESELLNPGTLLSLSELSESTLAITITPEDGERYQSIVPMESNSLAACLEDYFARSEQLPTWFKFFSQEQRAVGIALHALPNEKAQDSAGAQTEFERLRVLLASLTEQEAFELDEVAILTRLFHAESCRLFEGNAIQYGCTCSAQKSLEAIRSLGPTEISELIAQRKAENQKSIVVDCHFCFQRYEFGFEEIDSMHSTSTPSN